MAKFLVRDDSQICGYKEISGPLSRTRELSYVPWAMSGERVVYAPTGMHRARPHHGNLRPYDTAASQQRRRLCQTKLGSLALANPAWTRSAVQAVSFGVKRYLISRLFVDREGTMAAYAAKVGKYMYGSRYLSFGRFSDSELTGPDANQRIFEQAIETLDKGSPLPSVLSIHDGVGKMLGDKDPKKKVYEQRLAKLRPAKTGEIFDPGARGRTDNKNVSATTTAGIVGGEFATRFDPLQSRKRGVDMYARAVPRYGMQEPIPTTATPELSGVSYYRDLDTRNELFGAGPSGTTGTLLAAGFAFGDLTGENLRQYILAVIGYLVGGGMHSLHESLSVIRLLGSEFGMQYHSGSLLGHVQSSGQTIAKSDSLPVLPETFKGSGDFQRWRDDYYDIVILGGTHWMFNARN